jgi:hypothetical protein
MGTGGGPQVVHLDPKGVDRIRWENAKTSALIINRVQVQIDHLEVGLVMARNKSNQVVPVSQRSYLSVFLTLENTGDFPLEYHTWYREGGSAKSRHKPVSIQDNVGTKYPIRTFPGFENVRGSATAKKLMPREKVNDVLVFEHPLNPTEEVKYYMLSLPASAYGGEGTYRFEIPLDMVRGW